MAKTPHIGTLSEKSLHAALKDWYTQPGDQIEVKCDGFVIDIVRGEQLIEIQTRNFSAMKRKLPKLLEQYRLHLLHPICREKWIVRQSEAGELIQRRKSPKRGQVWDVFKELVYVPHLITHPNFSLELLLTQEEEIWRDDGQGSWRRKKWSIHDRLLLNVVEQIRFDQAADWLSLLPNDLPIPFTNRDLTALLKIRPAQAQKLTYTLRQANLISQVGKQGRSFAYEITASQS